MKQIHHFQIPSKELEEITRDENLEQVKNKKTMQLKGNYLEPFIKFISIVEGEEMKLQKRNNSIYQDNKKMFLRINADCKVCPKKDPVHYVIIIKRKPTENEKFVDVKLEIKNKHNHNHDKVPQKQYRGEERLKIAEDIFQAGGSNAYVLEQFAAGNGAPKRATARKIVSSYKNKGFSSDWLHHLWKINAKD